MAILTETTPATARSTSRFFLTSLADCLSAAIERHKSRRMLAALDDRMLADIGLSRADADNEATQPFWR